MEDKMSGNHVRDFAVNAAKVLLLSLIINVLSLSVPFASDWPVFRGNDARTGFTAEQAYPPLTPRWQFDVQGDVFSSPVVYKGILYVGARSGSIYALNAFTGELIWDYSTEDWVDASPAVSEDSVFVPSRDGRLYALDRLTGAVLWSADLGASSVSSPLVMNGKVYVGTGEPQNMIKAFDAASGALLWAHQTAQPVDSAPATDGVNIYAGSNDGRVYGLNSVTGAALWPPSGVQQSFGSFGLSAVVFSSGSLYSLPGHDEKKLFKFNAAGGGQELVSAELDYAYAESQVTAPVMGPGAVYLGIGSGASDAIGTIISPITLYSLNRQTLADLWSGSSPSLGSGSPLAAPAAPSMANEILYACTADSRLVAVSTAANFASADINLSAASFTSPAISNGWVYVGTVGGKILAYKASKIAAISAPAPYELVDASVTVKGYIKNGALAGYELDHVQGEGSFPGTFISSAIVSSEIENSALGVWDTSLLSNGLYTLRLSVIESAASGTDATAKVTVRVNHPPLPPPALTAYDVPADSGNKIRLDWTASPTAGATAYRIYRGTSPAMSLLVSVSSSTLFYIDATAVTGTTFTYTVRAWDGYTQSQASNQVSLFSIDNDPSSDHTAPSAVSDLAGVPGTLGGRVALAWTAPGGDGTVGSALGYVIRYTTSAAYDWAGAFNSAALWTGSKPVSGQYGAPETEEVRGLFGGVTYYFAVKAFDHNGNKADVSNIASAWALVDMVAPAAPSSFTVVDAPGDHGGALRLEWVLSPDDGAGAGDVYGYRIYKGVSPAGYSSASPYVSVGAGVNKYTDPDATANIRYYYAVAAFDSSNLSVLSNEAWGISADNWRFLDSSNGGTVRLADGTEVDISQNAASQSDNIMVVKLDPATYLPQFTARANTAVNPTPVVYEIKFEDPSTKLLKNARIVLPYSAADVSGMNEENLRIYTLTGGTWMILNTSRPDPQADKVSAEVSRFSIFRIMEYVPSGALLTADAVYTYPNPARGENLTFKFFVSDKSRVTVDVYNVAGEKVARLEKAGCPAGMTSEIVWHIENIASGVYVYRLTAESSSGSKTITKKLAIIH